MELAFKEQDGEMAAHHDLCHGHYDLHIADCSFRRRGDWRSEEACPSRAAAPEGYYSLFIHIKCKALIYILSSRMPFW